MELDSWQIGKTNRRGLGGSTRGQLRASGCHWYEKPDKWGMGSIGGEALRWTKRGPIKEKTNKGLLDHLLQREENAHPG